MAFEGFGGWIGRGDGGTEVIRPDGGSCFLRLAVAIGLITTLGACAHVRPEPEIRTVEVKVPVAQPCTATVTTHKTYSDEAAEFTTDILEQAKELLAGRAERMADAERLKGAVTGCGGTVK